MFRMTFQKLLESMISANIIEWFLWLFTTSMPVGAKRPCTFKQI